MSKIGATPSHLRRLRFDLDVRANESVPGVIARGTAGHHLVKLGRVLKEAGAGRRAGLTQLADPAILSRLAYVVRTDAPTLIAQSGRRLIEPGDRRLQHFVDFAGLVLPSGHLELRRRRISPLALLEADHHRQAWMMAVLPFCTETLERLVDTCPLCGFALGWVETAGIARCEKCLKTIPPSSLPALPEELAENYRLFARLLSLQPAKRSASIGAMPPRLREFTPGELARLAMRCGLDCDDGGEKRAWQTRAGRLPPERIAAIAARGIALLRSWPRGISAWAEDRLEGALDERACRRDLQYRIKRIAWGDSGFSDQRVLLSEVFPGLEAPAGRTDHEMSAFYTGRQANRRLPGFKEVAPELRRLEIVPHRPASNTGSIVTYLYPAGVIDAAAQRIADSTSISSIMDQLRLPLYAAEQMFEAQLFDRYDDPVLAVILRRPLAVASSYAEFTRRLKACRSRRTLPVGALPIGHETRRIGGRAKPWSDIYEALLAKCIPFWLEGGIGSDRLLVAPGSLDDFITMSPRLVETAAADMSTRDAAELLNVTPGSVRSLRSARVLPQSAGPRALVSPRKNVARLASKYVSAAEIARRARTSAEHVNDQLVSFGFESYHGLWNRSQVLDVLPLK